MSLRLRLVVVLFLVSVVPLGAVTFFTFRSNLDTMRDAAIGEAEQLTGDLTGRMETVTDQLQVQFTQLLELPAASAETTDVMLPASGPLATAADAVATAATPTAEQQVAEQLGEVAMLLNNIEVRGVWRGRRGTTPGPLSGQASVCFSTSGPTACRRR